VLMELTADLIPNPNPYLPLIGLHRLGCFPMGWEDGEYTLYIHDDPNAPPTPAPGLLGAMIDRARGLGRARRPGKRRGTDFGSLANVIN